MGRHVILAEFVKAVIEELHVVLDWVKVRVLAAVEVAAIIAQPDIVSSLGQHDRKRFGAVDYPGRRITEKTMLQKCDLSPRLNLGTLHPIHLQNISIFCGDPVHLTQQSLLLDELAQCLGHQSILQITHVPLTPTKSSFLGGIFQVLNT